MRRLILAAVLAEGLVEAGGREEDQLFDAVGEAVEEVGGEEAAHGVADQDRVLQIGDAGFDGRRIFAQTTRGKSRHVSAGLVMR